MAKPKKPQRLKAQQPRGFGDRSAADIRATDAMMAKIKGVYELYGFDPVETPFFEYTDALGKFLPDTDRPNAGVFSLQDDDEKWMSLRYDLTAPLARHFAQNINDLQTPYRTYRAGWVFRNEKPGPGRFRQFTQFDADIVGAPNASADAEMCMMMADTMEALGLKGQYVVKVNSRILIDAILNVIGLSNPEDEGRRLGVLRALDKLDRLGEVEVQKLLGAGRRDDSGDWTDGVKLTSSQIEKFSNLLTWQKAFTEKKRPDKVFSLQRVVVEDDENVGFSYKLDWLPVDEPEALTPDEFFEESLLLLPQVITSFGANFSGSESLRDLDYSEIDERFRSELKRGYENLFDTILMLREVGYGSEKIAVDLTCVRGLEYYTGTVFECELTFPVKNEKGEEVVFGSVAGGGRYDGLIKRFTGQDIPATGFSIGVSRLMTALKNLGKLNEDEVLAPVIVGVMDRDADALAGYQKMVQELRQAGIRAEMYQGNPKQFGKQLQYADRRGSPIAIIQGSQEREAGEVQVKDLVEGLRLSEEITDNAEWRAARPAQRTVKREDLVDTVKAVLAEQKAEREAEAAAT
ncbi:HisS family protein [Ahrensia sp. R2A130]|uniref:histidine--tRNA ligase n=1 Tax=Ahrensia sp. R2A130 TaxID=744979 RepID=UPI0001E09463|nr:HisS family protein [Ahrensia sp. R2A130]EFL88544.1 histidyl-tRNA synthetase [Ahrensia sp. R2A130]